jgi:MSHA pilin protein MshD
MQAIVMFREAKNQSGITLVELIVTIVVLGIALISVSGILQGGASRSSDITLQIRATALAQSYLDEILGKRYDEKTRNRGIPPCRASAAFPRQCTAEASFGFNYGAPVESGENSRFRLDDVDDYHGMDEGDGQTLPLQDAQGNTRTGYDNFRVRVAVRYINIGVGEEEETLGVNNELDDEFDAKLVTVTVSFRGDATGWDFSAYKSNF